EPRASDREDGVDGFARRGLSAIEGPSFAAGPRRRERGASTPPRGFASSSRFAPRARHADRAGPMRRDPSLRAADSERRDARSELSFARSSRPLAMKPTPRLDVLVLATHPDDAES